jgi:predicted Fe-Mo cluster-binding NifX family protein
MKIGFSAGADLGANSFLEGRFGRASGFVIHDSELGNWQWIANGQNTESVSGAGIQAAQTVIRSGASVFIGGNFGPKAFKVLQAGGVRLVQGRIGLTLAENLNQFQKGMLAEVSEPTSVGF